MKTTYFKLVAIILLGAGCNQKRDAEFAEIKQRVIALEEQVARLNSSNSQLVQDREARIARETRETLKRIDDQERAGTITSEKADELRSILSGKIKLYVTPDGSYSTNQFSK